MSGMVHTFEFLNDLINDAAGAEAKKILFNALLGGGIGYFGMKWAKTFSFAVGMIIIFIELSNQQGMLDYDVNQMLLDLESKLDQPCVIKNFLQKWNERGFYGGLLVGASIS